MSLVRPRYSPILILLLCLASSPLLAQQEIEIPADGQTHHIAVTLPRPSEADSAAPWRWVAIATPDRVVPAQVSCALRSDGTVDKSRLQVLASFAAMAAPETAMKYRLERGEGDDAQPCFRFADSGDASVDIIEQDSPILRYNFGTITDATVPADSGLNARGCYIHPVWGLQGEILTDDFPKDHFHHHGIFWTWPYVKVGDQTYDLWLSSDIQQRFVGWLHRESGPVAAVLGVENGWYVGQQQVATERVWIRAFRSEGSSRSIDITLVIQAADQPVTLQGRQQKSYGGLTFRFHVWPRTDAQVRVPGKTLGNDRPEMASEEDLLNAPLPWADLASTFPPAAARSGAAVFIHPQHPDYPPTWLTRTYGALCVGWPGVKPYTIAPQESIRLDYRIWVHQSEVSPEIIGQAYQAYQQAASIDPH